MIKLIQADQKRRAEERIDALLLAGLNSGEPIWLPPDDWDARKRKLAERVSQATDPSA